MKMYHQLYDAIGMRVSPPTARDIPTAIAAAI